MDYHENEESTNFAASTSSNFDSLAGSAVDKSDFLVTASYANCQSGTSQYIMPEDILRWFHNLEVFLFESHGIDAGAYFQKGNAHRIYSCSEIIFRLNVNIKMPKRIVDKKVVPKKARYSKTSIKVIVAANASGEYLPPMFVCEGKRPQLWNKHSSLVAGEFYVSTDVTNKTDGEVFYQWLHNFQIFINEKCLERPVILLLNNHIKYINKAVVSFCNQACIILYSFPSNSSEILHPIESKVLPVVTKTYGSLLYKICGELKTPTLEKRHFPIVFMESWKRTITKELAVTGFRACGLVPFKECIPIPSNLLDSTTETKNHSAYEILSTLSTFVESLLKPDVLEMYRDRYSMSLDDPKHEATYKIWAEIKNLKAVFAVNAREDIQFTASLKRYKDSCKQQIKKLKHKEVLEKRDPTENDDKQVSAVCELNKDKIIEDQQDPAQDLNSSALSISQPQVLLHPLFPKQEGETQVIDLTEMEAGTKSPLQAEMLPSSERLEASSSECKPELTELLQNHISRSFPINPYNSLAFSEAKDSSDCSKATTDDTNKQNHVPHSESDTAISESLRHRHSSQDNPISPKNEKSPSVHVEDGRNAQYAKTNSSDLCESDNEVTLIDDNGI